MTVFDDPTFPQYLYYDENAYTFSPLTEENAGTHEEWNNTKIENLFEFLTRLFKVLREYFPVLIEKIKGAA